MLHCSMDVRHLPEKPDTWKMEMTDLAINQSGQQLAKVNILKFEAWIAERYAAGDWKDYVRAGKLNRSEIAMECGFALSVLRQNPAVKIALTSLENHLRAQDILAREVATDSSNDADEASTLAADKRVMSAKALADARVKVLEEQNATLRAEICDLKIQLAHFQHLDEHLSRTGRLLPP